MSCPEFEKYGFLFLSGELDHDVLADYKRHTKGCKFCQREINNMRSIFSDVESKEYVPDPVIRQTILLKSCRRPLLKRVQRAIDKYYQKWLRFRYRGLILSTAAVTVVMLIFIVHPFGNAGNFNEKNNLVWNDDFFFETLCIDDDINDICLLSNDMVMSYDDEVISIMAEDFITIRNGIEALRQQINVF